MEKFRLCPQTLQIWLGNFRH